MARSKLYLIAILAHLGVMLGYGEPSRRHLEATKSRFINDFDFHIFILEKILQNIKHISIGQPYSPGTLSRLWVDTLFDLPSCPSPLIRMSSALPFITNAKIML